MGESRMNPCRGRGGATGAAAGEATGTLSGSGALPRGLATSFIRPSATEGPDEAGSREDGSRDENRDGNPRPPPTACCEGIRGLFAPWRGRSVPQLGRSAPRSERSAPETEASRRNDDGNHDDNSDDEAAPPPSRLPGLEIDAGIDPGVGEV